jgi:hypothetical protein
MKELEPMPVITFKWPRPYRSKWVKLWWKIRWFFMSKKKKQVISVAASKDLQPLLKNLLEDIFKNAKRERE